VGRLFRAWDYFLVAGVLLADPVPVFSAESTVVVPPGYENTTGSGFQRPFDVSSQRLLFLYDGSLLSSAMPNGAMITAIAFRPEETELGSLTVDIPSIEIRMSTSPHAVHFGSELFSDYIGADVKTVLARGPLHIDATGVANPRSSFSYVIPLSTPFTYDPRKGPLSVDILTFEGSPLSAPVDLTTQPSASLNFLGGSTTSDRALGSLSAGAVLQLEFVAIPEPSAASLLLLCLSTIVTGKVLLT